MGNTTTTIACVSCQSFCLKPATSGTNLESLLADAEINRYAVSGMRVVKLNRDGLMRLGKRLGYPPRYKVMVDNHQSLDIKQYDLFKYSLIIVKVINNRIMIRCLEDGQEPRKGRDLDWEKIRKYANSGYYDDWNLGYKWIWKGRDLDWEKIRKYANLGYYDYWNLGYGWIWKGRDLDWEKIRKYANLGYYDYWNLGSGWICQRPEPTEIGKWMEQKPTNNMPRFRAV